MKPFRRIIRVERNVRATCLEGGKYGDHQIDASLHAHANPRVGPHTPSHEIACKPVGAAIELPVAQYVTCEPDRFGIGMQPRFVLEELMNERVARKRGRGCVEFIDAASFRRRQDGKLAKQ